MRRATLSRSKGTAASTTCVPTGKLTPATQPDATRPQAQRMRQLRPPRSRPQRAHACIRRQPSRRRHHCHVNKEPRRRLLRRAAKATLPQWLLPGTMTPPRSAHNRQRRAHDRRERAHALRRESEQADDSKKATAYNRTCSPGNRKQSATPSPISTTWRGWWHTHTSAGEKRTSKPLSRSSRDPAADIASPAPALPPVPPPAPTPPPPWARCTSR